MGIPDWLGGHEQSPLLVPLAELALLAAAIFLADSLLTLAGLGVAAALGLWAWWSALRHARAIADTPTSRIHAAAQGYVELVGQGRPLPTAPLFSPMSHLPCLWYSYTSYRRVNDDWEVESRGTSDQVFLLDDGTGHCLVDPAGAKVLSSHQETREVKDHKYTETLLLAGDRLYVLGQFRTTSPTHQGLDHSQDLDDLLSQWKDDPAELLRRFDRDGNGQLDGAEWAEAVAAARRVVADQHQGLQRQPGRHHLGKPPDGRPFLISDHPPGDLERHYGIRIWFQAGMLLLILGVAVWRVHALA